MAEVPTKNDPEEKQFRRKNLWHSFMQAAYGSLAGASFFGALLSISSGVIGLAAGLAKFLGFGAGVGGAGMEMAAANAFIVSNPVTLAALGGLIVTGLAFTYLSQREGTELKVLQDEHTAQQNARAKQLCVEQGICNTAEYPQNQRADGKQWQNVVQAPAQAASRQLQ